MVRVHLLLEINLISVVILSGGYLKADMLAMTVETWTQATMLWCQETQREGVCVLHLLTWRRPGLCNSTSHLVSTCVSPILSYIYRGTQFSFKIRSSDHFIIHLNHSCAGNRACTTVVDQKSEVFLYIEDADGYSIQLMDLGMEGNEVRYTYTHMITRVTSPS